MAWVIVVGSWFRTYVVIGMTAIRNRLCVVVSKVRRSHDVGSDCVIMVTRKKVA